MRRALMAITTVSQFLLVAGGLVFNWLASTRMGLARHVLQRNAKWQQTLPVDIIKYLAAVLVLLGVCWAIWKFVKKAGGPRCSYVVLAILGLLTTLFVLIVNPTILRAYYYLAPLFLLVTVLQMVKCLLAGGNGKKEG